MKEKKLTLYDVRRKHQREQSQKRRKRLAAKLNIACSFGGPRSMINYYAARIDKELKNSINGTIVISIASLLRNRA